MTYLSDKEQAQILKDLWKKYGFTILLSILIFLSVNFLWRYWLQYQTQQHERASIVFSQMINAQTQNKTSEAELFATNLMKNFSHSAYASFAAMQRASEAVKNNNLATAQTNLNWVINHARKGELSGLARIRLARVLIADNKPQEAFSLLEKNTSTLYLPAKYEIMGDALIAQNKPQEALTFYRKALEQNDNSNKDALPSPLLKIKSEQLAPSVN